MRRMWFWLVPALMFASVAWAQSPFESSRWRATVTVDTVSYRIWIDEEIRDFQYTQLTSNWSEFQRNARHYCLRCDLGAWGDAELNAQLSHHDVHDYDYVPLDTLTFLPVVIEVERDTLTTNRSWRSVERDSVIVELKDGTRLVSLGPVDMKPVHLSMSTSWQRSILLCNLVRRGLAPIPLFTRSQLAFLTRVNPDHFPDKPWANQGLVPIRNRGHHFSMNDVRSIWLYFLGQRVVLERIQTANLSTGE